MQKILQSFLRQIPDLSKEKCVYLLWVFCRPKVFNSLLKPQVDDADDSSPEEKFERHFSLRRGRRDFRRKKYSFSHSRVREWTTKLLTTNSKQFEAISFKWRHLMWRCCCCWLYFNNRLDSDNVDHDASQVFLSSSRFNGEQTTLTEEATRKSLSSLSLVVTLQHSIRMPTN